MGPSQLTHEVSGLNSQVAPCRFSTIRTLLKRILKNKWPTGDYTMVNDTKFTQLATSSQLSAAVPLPIKVSVYYHFK